MINVPFFHGAVALGCVLAGMFFLRFWQRSRDRLFLHFAFAFWILGVSYVLLGLVAFANEFHVYVFVGRLIAFCMILYGILQKNRTG